MGKELAGLTKADTFGAWAMTAGLAGVCAEAQAYDKEGWLNGKHINELMYHSAVGEKIQELYKTLPKSCQDWPFNEDYPMNFGNMVAFQAKQMHTCNIPLAKVFYGSDYKAAL